MTLKLNVAQFGSIRLILIEIDSIQYNAGQIQHFEGHVMSEIYIDNKWILLDNNCTYIEEYDPTNPFISTFVQSEGGYFAFGKGIDIWDYTKKDDEFTWKQMVFLSDNVYCFDEMFNTVTYDWSRYYPL